jgi:hypothetical protein
MLVLIVAAWVGQAVAKQNSPPPNRDAVMLTTGKTAARSEALGRILATPPGARTRDVWEALRDELNRVVACLDVQKPSPAQRRKLHCEVGISHNSEDSDYLLDLISAVSQSDDPATIPTLIRVAPGHAGARLALVNFGDVAVPALIESALSSRSGPWVSEDSGSMSALGEMVVGDHISAASRARIIDTARSLLRDKFTWVNEITVVYLALATGDPVLRDEITKMANDSSELIRRGIPPEHIEQVQRGIRYELAHPPKP